MNYSIPPYRIFPLGDSGAVIDLGNVIDSSLNDLVISLFDHFQQHPFPGLVELVPAYSSLTVYYDPTKIRGEDKSNQTAFDIITRLLEGHLQRIAQPAAHTGRHIRIPVCYNSDFGTDLLSLASYHHLLAADVIRLHTEAIYKVYMLGFLPGFAYMGEVNHQIATPRKEQPMDVMAGSVGIAGKQTGIYPFTSPGGWQVIGRTPLKLFDVSKEQPVLLRAGDSIQFYSISENEFNSY